MSHQTKIYCKHIKACTLGFYILKKSENKTIQHPSCLALMLLRSAIFNSAPSAQIKMTI